MKPRISRHTGRAHATQPLVIPHAAGTSELVGLRSALAHERAERLRAERLARVWHLKADILALAQTPQSAEAFVAQAVIEIQRHLGARQTTFWAYLPADDSLEARNLAAPECPDRELCVPLGLFQEVVAARQPRTVSLISPDGEARVMVLGPVFAERGLAGVVQLTLPEATLGGLAEAELAAACEAIATGLKIVLAFERLCYQASHDPLTGLANRRTFQATLDRELKLSKRHDSPLSLVVVDVDHFKRYNDTHGHAAGDALLIEIAKALASAARGTDFVARYGGEEFVAILPHTDREGGRVAAQKLLDAIASIHTHAEVLSGHVTASLGVATLEGAMGSPESLFVAADRAMYKAKAAGRNRVCDADT